MNYGEFLFYKYRDSVIMVTQFRKEISRDYGLDSDDITRLVNRILDYQKKIYGDVLDATFYELSKEAKERLRVRALARRYYRRNRERR